jgi:hypothetical protein
MFYPLIKSKNILVPLALSSTFSIYSQPSLASDWQSITQEVIYDNGVVGYVQIPDWDRLSFADFPGILSNGSIGSEYNNYVDYDLSRTWHQGDLPEQFLKLGDLAEALALQKFKLQDVVNITGIDLEQIALSQFPLIGEQTLEELVEAIPDLGNFQVKDIEPIADLIKDKVGYSYEDFSLDNVINTGNLGELKLEEIDLSQYSIDSIPNITDARLEDFTGWENSFVGDIPGLAAVPLGLMPIPITNTSGVVSRIDAIWSEAESYRNNTVSGSYQEGFNVPCETNCAHIELDDLENSGSQMRSAFEGQQWISGQFQEVAGGQGVLGVVNGGVEPTGRHPFGKVFKVAVLDTDETTDGVSSSLFFRFCLKTAFVDLGCTPYFIGPIPFLDYKRDDWILLGN